MTAEQLPEYVAYLVIPWKSQEGALADYEHYRWERKGYGWNCPTRTEWQTRQIATSGFYICSKDHTQATEVEPYDRSELSDKERIAEMISACNALLILRSQLWREI